MKMETSIVINNVFVLLFIAITFVSSVVGWLFYCANIERANKWKNIGKLTEKAAWWLSGVSGLGFGITFIIVMFNSITFIELWWLIASFSIMSIATIFFVIIAAVLMYQLIFKMVVEDTSNPQNYN